MASNVSWMATQGICHLAIGSIYFVQNVRENHESIHFMERVFCQNFFPQRVFTQAHIITSEGSVYTGNIYIYCLKIF